MDIQALFSLVQPYQVLQRNGVDFVNIGGGRFSLYKDGVGVELDCGSWSAIWMNNFIRSKVKGVNLFPLDFSQDNALSNIGRLARENPALADTFKGASGFELDNKLAHVFTEFKVELGKVGSKIMDLKTAYILDTIEPIPAHELLELTEDGLSQICLGEGEGPFYKAVDLRQFKTSVTNDSVAPPKIWANFIVRERLHWNLQARILYLSNASTAKWGLPPNHEILDFNMALEVEDWKISLVVDPVQNHPVVDAGDLEQASSGDWEKLYTQFAEHPSSHSLNLLRTREIRRAFKSFKDTEVYNYGASRKFKLTSKVLDRFAGTAKAATYTELARAIREVAGTDIRVQFCLLMKLEGQVRQTLGDGEDADRFYLNSL